MTEAADCLAPLPSPPMESTSTYMKTFHVGKKKKVLQFTLS